jgi:DNA-binding XRE family transcriptional regulator
MHIMMDSIHNTAAADDVLSHVSTNIKRFRLAARLSQEALAKASGLSRRLLINLEAGDTNISLGKLASLAQALGVEFGAIVADPSANTQRIAEVMWRGENTSMATLLGSAPTRSSAGMSAWVLDVGDSYPAEPDPPGQYELIFVYEGRLHLSKDDGDVMVNVQDFVIFSSAQNYSYRNAGHEVLRFVRVLAS